MTELKKCPFCGGGWGITMNCYSDDNTTFHVECCDCGARTEEFKTQDEAIEAWNRSADT